MIPLKAVSSRENLILLYANNKGADQHVHSCNQIGEYAINSLRSIAAIFDTFTIGVDMTLFFYVICLLGVVDRLILASGLAFFRCKPKYRFSLDLALNMVVDQIPLISIGVTNVFFCYLLIWLSPVGRSLTETVGKEL